MRLAVTSLLMFTLAGSVFSQTASPTNNAPDFRWSERQAHELDYRHTIKTSTKLTFEQRQSLLNAVLAQLRHKTFEGTSGQELKHLAANTRIEFVDLNGDGKKEVIAQSNGQGPCGGTGNCFVWVFEQTLQGYKVLLDSTEGK